jgi:hypothetical protein
VSRFLEDAVHIFETASNAPRDGSSQDLAILLDSAGALRIVDADGWAPEALEFHYGARTVYQVTRGRDGVRVSGRSQGRRCTLSSKNPAALLFPAVLGAPQYEVVPPRWPNTTSMAVELSH